MLRMASGRAKGGSGFEIANSKHGGGEDWERGCRVEGRLKSQIENAANERMVRGCGWREGGLKSQADKAAENGMGREKLVEGRKIEIPD